MRPDEWSTIRALPLFREMSEENFGALMNAAFLQKFPARVNLITEGDLPDFLHIVVEGPVELFANHDGHETTLDIIGPVTTFILAAVIRDEPYLKSARTLSPAQILMVPAPTVRDVFDRDAAFARAIVNELAQRYRGIVKALEERKAADQRSAACQLDIVDGCPARGPTAGRFGIRQTYYRIEPWHEPGKPLPQSGAADGPRHPQLCTRHRYRKPIGPGTICQAESSDR